jgi:hypothetical protein
LTANNASKAILRAALDEFLRSHWQEVNQSYYYFPSYEMVTDVFSNPFTNDNRHLYESVPRRILDVFARSYTTHNAVDPGRDGAAEQIKEDESQELVAHLETRNEELQRICDERFEVIRTLEQVAGERLALIEELERVATERLAIIGRLSEADRPPNESQGRSDAK